MMIQRFIKSLLMSALILGAGSSQAQTLSATISQAAPGSLARFNVYVDPEVRSLTALQFQLQFGSSSPTNAPPLMLDTHAEITSPMFPNSYREINRTASTLSVAIAGTEGKNGPGTVLSVPFRIPVSAQRDMRYFVKIRSVVAYDGNQQQIPLTIRDGQFIVSSPNAVGIRVSSGFGPSGGTATLLVSAAETVKSVSGAQFNLSFSPELTVKKSDVTLGGLIPGSLEVNAEQPGRLSIAAAASSAKNGPGVIVKVVFNIPASAPAGKQYDINITDARLVTHGVTRSVQSVGGQINVTAKSGQLPVIEGGLIRVESLRAYRTQKALISIQINEKIRNMNGVQFRLVFSAKSPSSAPDLYMLSPELVPSPLLPGAARQVNSRIPGEITVGIASSRAGNGPGTLVKIPLTVPENAPGNTVYTLELKDVVFSIDGVDYTAPAEGGTLTTIGRKNGDFANVEGRDSGDSRVDSSDAIALLRYVVGLSSPTVSQLDAADTNCDDNISISDVVRILRHIVGLDQICGFTPQLG